MNYAGAQFDTIQIQGKNSAQSQKLLKYVDVLQSMPLLLCKSLKVYRIHRSLKRFSTFTRKRVQAGAGVLLNYYVLFIVLCSSCACSASSRMASADWMIASVFLVTTSLISLIDCEMFSETVVCSLAAFAIW